MSSFISVVPGDKSSSSDGPKYDEDYNLLNSDSETVIDKEGEKEEDESESKEITAEEEDTEKEEVEEEEEEPEPIQIPFDRPSIKDIKAAYPDFFKKFPQLKDAIFREARFTSFFPTVEDAQEAFNDNEAFVALSDSALNGDSSPFIDSIFKTDPKAATAFSASFLPNLYKKDPEAYSVVITPVFENLLRQAYKSGDENMKNSALNLAEFLFGKDGEDSVTGKKTISKTVQLTEESKKTATEKESLNATAFRTAAANVSNIVSRSMQSLVAKDFDPDKVFTKTVRDMLIQDIVSKIDRKLNFDKAHIAVMGARWKRAKSSGYSKDDESKLVSAYLARAKSLIPSVRETVRAAALGKTIQKNLEKPLPRREVNGGAVPRSTNSRTEKEYSKMTDLEILNS